MKRAFRSFVLCTAIWAGIAPSAMANLQDMNEMTIVERELVAQEARLSSNFPAGLARLLPLLEDIEAPDATVEDAKAFLDFLRGNPEVFASDVREF